MDWSVHISRILARIGEDATFTPAVGSPATVRGMYTAPHQAVQLGSMEISSSWPVFAAMTSTLPAVAVGDAISVAAGSFTVRDVQPDAPSGVTVLELEEAV